MPPTASEIRHFFVYGTLCRGQCRQNLWPEPPARVIPATSRGYLYDRADYPAMRAGNDRVVGECWEFHARQMPAVISVLDEIEGTHQPGLPNLYNRLIVETLPIDSSAPRIWAFGYHYATDPALDGFTQMIPKPNGDAVRWPTGPILPNTT